MATVSFTPNSELEKEKKAKEELARIQEEQTKRAQVSSSLVAYVKDAWEKAKRAKDQHIKDRMIENMRQFRGEYTKEKLAAIQELGGSEAYVPITNIKCRAGEAWINEILIQPGQVPWDIQPSPVPDLPEEIVMEIRQKVTSQANSMLQSAAMAYAGQGIPMEEMRMQLSSLTGELKKFYEKEIERVAKEKAEGVKDKINDRLVEGKFYEALREAMHDLVILPAGIVKGPLYRKSKQISMMGGQILIDDKVTAQYERRSPFDIYPSPDSCNINDGYLIDKISVTPKDLYDLIGLEGFKEDAIRTIIEEYEGGGLTNWLEIDHEVLEVEGKPTSALYDSDRLDVLEFWGSLKGGLLQDWGMSAEEISDREKFYDVCVWMVKDTIIKAMLNYDPLGNKPYAKASFIEIPNSFWGMGVPDVLKEVQGVCNSLTRSIANNAAIGSGPLVERNSDRIPAYEVKKIYPWKIFDSTESQMNNAPAYRFYQPPMVVDKLLTVFQHFLKLADETSGIPAYAHGDVTVSGAGRTASGLSMLTSNANRGIKEVIKNIDKGILEDVVRRQYDIDLMYYLLGDDIPDMKIQAKGSISLVEKELQSVRRTEFLTATANPFDIQILGMEGRKFLLEETAKAHGLDVDRLFPATTTPLIPGAQAYPQTGGNPTGQTLNEAGQPIGGQDIAMYEGE